MFMNMHMLIVCIYDTCISIYDIYIYTHVYICNKDCVYAYMCIRTYTYNLCH